MKKKAKKKTLVLSVEKVRELRPVDASGLEGVAGGLICATTHGMTTTAADINN